VLVGAESGEDLIEALLHLCQGRAGFLVVDLGGMQVSFGPLPFIAELEDFDQVVAVPLEVRLVALVLFANAPFVSAYERQLLLLLLLVSLGRAVEGLGALKLRRLVSLRRRKAQGVPESHLLGCSTFQRKLIRDDPVGCDLIRCAGGCGHAWGHQRRRSGLRFGVGLAVRAGARCHDQGLLMVMGLLLIRGTTPIAFDLLLVLVAELRVGLVTVFTSLHFSCVITRIRQLVNDPLDFVELFLPTADVGVHAMNELSRLRCFHLFDRDVVPSAVLHLQVGQKQSDFEITLGEPLGREAVVADVVGDCFLRDVTVVQVEVLCQESGTPANECVDAFHLVVFNNYKHYLLYY